MDMNRAKGDGVMRVRLSPAQIDILAPGINLLVTSHLARLRKGSSPLAYPFRILPPPRDFDRGIYNQAFMEKIIELGESLKTKSENGRRVNVDTWQLRAAVFAIRAYIHYARLLRRQYRRKEAEFKSRVLIDDKSIAILKAKSTQLIFSLERHTKRANRALIKAVGKRRYATLSTAWKAHLRWMRLHIAYCKPQPKAFPCRRARLQRDLDELMEIAKRGLQEEGYKPPQDKELRRLMRLYARYAHQGRIGMWKIGFLHEDKGRFLRRYHLAQFVIDRSKHKESSRS